MTSRFVLAVVIALMHAPAFAAPSSLADMYMSGRGVAKSIGDGAHYYNEVCAKRVGGEASFIPECNAVLERMGL